MAAASTRESMSMVLRREVSLRRMGKVMGSLGFPVAARWQREMPRKVLWRVTDEREYGEGYPSSMWRAETDERYPLIVLGATGLLARLAAKAQRVISAAGSGLPSGFKRLVEWQKSRN
jgi:hypothetical protein